MRRDTGRTRLVLLLLLLTAVTLLVLDSTGGRSPVSGLRSAVGTVFGPMERAVGSVTHSVANAVDSVGGNRSAEVSRLRRDNAALRERLLLLGHQGARGQELDRLLRLAGAGGYRIVPAQVVAIGPRTSFAWTVTLDAGSRDGVTADMTVINGDGLVGRVVSATATTATVLLISDPQSDVGARLESTDELGYTTGRGDRPLSLTMLAASAPLHPGDRLVTAGSLTRERPYVPGVPIGRISSVRDAPGALTRSALVTPYARVSALDLVGVVVTPPRTDPRDSVLPPPVRPTGGG